VEDTSKQLFIESSGLKREFLIAGFVLMSFLGLAILSLTIVSLIIALAV
jgi:hypothetical protein